MIKTKDGQMGFAGQHVNKHIRKNKFFEQINKLIDWSEEEEREDKEELEMQVVKIKQPEVDNEARYLKKGKHLNFGFKKHVLVDENGLQLSVHTYSDHGIIMSNCKI